MPVRFVLITALALGILPGADSTAVGQAGDPVSATIRHPGYLQAGTCDRPGEPIAALAETSTGGGSGSTATPSAGEAAAIPAAVSVTEIDRPLDELMGLDLIARVVESVDDPDTAIVCGAIGGRPDADGNVYLTLTERDGSGVTGIVWLQTGADDTTIVTLFLIPLTVQDGSGNPSGSSDSAQYWRDPSAAIDGARAR